MSGNPYPIYWITDHLATGPAPMSYDHLDGLKAGGIDAIMNLCAEYCDLHDIQAGQGFEVYYLPIEDEETPQLQALEEALDWLDEAIYLGKRVYVHCRYGIGRTGTVISAYLLRRGLGSKLVKQKIKKMRSRPANFYQWWLVRKIGKKEGRLTIREPALEWKSLVDLAPFFADHEALLSRIDIFLDRQGVTERCGTEHAACCSSYVEVSLIEAAYLTHHLNRKLHREERRAAITRCGEIYRRGRELGGGSANQAAGFARLYADRPPLCPLSQAGRCLVAPSRPLTCRFFDLADGEEGQSLEAACRLRAAELSAGLFLALVGELSSREPVTFPLLDVVSGKFVQTFFYLLSRPAD
ncbi:dual specificity protein phosphatase family protein [Desulfurivibrio sp. D14AmB]|uniref:protein-tyrosine phosphatase family protein n=1 Tax=Desulfurivibrio sp. D14AmB TaxID=3374370 RepID=UPI00376ECEF6